MILLLVMAVIGVLFAYHLGRGTRRRHDRLDGFNAGWEAHQKLAGLTYDHEDIAESHGG